MSAYMQVSVTSFCRELLAVAPMLWTEAAVGALDQRTHRGAVVATAPPQPRSRYENTALQRAARGRHPGAAVGTPHARCLAARPLEGATERLLGFVAHAARDGDDG